MRGAEAYWTSLRERALDALYPPRCALCGFGGTCPICSVCLGEFDPYPAGIHRSESSPLEGWACVWRYTGRAAQAVQRLKYARATSLAGPMSQLLAEAAGNLGLDDCDAVVPVPIHRSRFFLRGFNQSEMLSEGFDPSRVRPRLLARTRPTRPQAGLSREARQSNLAGAFEAGHVEGMRILLVDDVRTSGGTLDECAQALLGAGAKLVSAIAFAGG